jgi:sulfur carrier protein ThiS
MPECDYCDRSFDDEAGYHEHLRNEHAQELGPIDQRRVATDDGAGGLPTGPLALGLVLLIAAGVVGYLVFLPGSGGGSSEGEPTDLGAVHYHGTMEVVIDGQRVDFSRSQYQLQADAFHFEANEGRRWHAHARGVTLAWAMESLGIPVTAETVTFEGRTYDDSDPDTTVTIRVNGEPVTPSSYVLQRGDRVRIVVEVQ